MQLKLYTKEFGYNLLLAYPIIMGMLGHTMVGIIDNMMVGQLGATELAAVSLGNSFVFIGMSIGIGFSTAITPLVAASDREEAKEHAKSVFHNGLFLCTILGVLLFLIIFASKPLLYMMGQPEEVVVLAKPYLDIVAFSLIPLVMFQAYKQFADGKSETKYSMWATIVANLVNLLINYLLIFGIWIFPALGIIGAAIGTIASRIVMLLMIHLLLKYNPKFDFFLTGFKWQDIRATILRKIAALGTPSALQMLFEVTLFTSAVWLTGILGTNTQAANQIALSLASFTFMFAMGFSVAVMIRVGNQKGLMDFPKLRVVAMSNFLLVLLLQCAFALLFILLHKYLPFLFIESSQQLEANIEEVLNIASQLLIIAAFFQLADGLQVVVLGALRGLQDVKIPMYYTFVAYWLVGFPVSVYLGLYTNLGAKGIWWGLFSGLTVAAVLLFWRFHQLTKKLIASTT